MTLLSASNQIAILGSDLIKFEIVKLEDLDSKDASSLSWGLNLRFHAYIAPAPIITPITRPNKSSMPQD
jgi:hypothetical protein